jgi:BASS family bile acid:Na+ symporter
MIRFQDGLLLGVTFSSIFIGVAFPEIGSLFSEFPKFCMMALLFLSFLSIKIAALWNGLRCRFREILLFLCIKLIFLPILFFYIFKWIAPEYAFSALLLSGISTGVVAPFFADTLEADVSKVILVVVTSSILVPFTLPVLVECLIGRQMDISLRSMVQLLSLVVFIPALGVEVLRRIQPSAIDLLLRVKQPFSLVLFALTNMGVFSRYSAFLQNQTSVVLIAFGVAILLAIFYFLAGLAFSWKKPIQDKVTVILMFGIMNNILVVVFSSEFFSPLEPTVAAAYCIPFFSFIIPLRIMQAKSQK